MRPCSSSSLLGLSLACLLCGLLTGCQLSSTSAPTPDAGAAIKGKVMGGQQVIVGAQVYVFAANTTGYGGAGIAASSNNASISLLTSGTGRTLDASGGPTNGDYYVTTDSTGSFSITGDYSCTSNQQVYLYSLGGNPGSGANSAAGLLEVLGNCRSGGSFATQTPYVVINEVTTVAAAYAFAGFATDATHVSSSGTTLALTGITNAFANALSLASIVSGNAYATTPAGNGVVPQSEINTLADILAACINSAGPGSTGCTTLMTNALSGGTTGIQPSDTATAAINIAHNPGANISGLASVYALVQADPPFQPTLSEQPNDLTVGLNFTGGGLNTTYGIAIDGAGRAWVRTSAATASPGWPLRDSFFRGPAGIRRGI
jgi:hypothetical protein